MSGTMTGRVEVQRVVSNEDGQVVVSDEDGQVIDDKVRTRIA